MITHSYYPQDPRVRREAEALVSAGFEVDVLCLRKSTERSRDVHNGVRIFRLPISRHRGSGLLVYALEYLAFLIAATVVAAILFVRHGYRVLQTHTIPDFLVFATIMPRILGAPVVLDMHEVMPEFFAAKFRLAQNHPLIVGLRLIERVSTSFASVVLTVSDPIRNILVGRGVSPAKSHVVMNSADEKIFTPVQNPGLGAAPAAVSVVPATEPAGSTTVVTEEKQGKVSEGESISQFGEDTQTNKTRPFRFIYHGLLSELYDLRPVFQALALLRNKKHQAYELSIIGDGPMLAKYRTLSQELGLDQVVRFHGEVPVERIPAFLQGADAAIIPLRREGFTDLAMPTKFLECIAMGIPVVAADRATLRYYFGDECVLYFTPEDVASIAAAIEKLAVTPALCAELARNATRRYETISWPFMRRRYVELIEKIARVK